MFKYTIIKQMVVIESGKEKLEERAIACFDELKDANKVCHLIQNDRALYYIHNSENKSEG